MITESEEKFLKDMVDRYANIPHPNHPFTDAVVILAKAFLARKEKDANPIPILYGINEGYHPPIQKAAEHLFSTEGVEKVLNDFFFEMEGVTNYLTNDKRGIWNHAVDNLRNRLIHLNEKDGR